MESDDGSMDFDDVLAMTASLQQRSNLNANLSSKEPAQLSSPVLVASPPSDVGPNDDVGENVEVQVPSLNIQYQAPEGNLLSENAEEVQIPSLDMQYQAPEESLLSSNESPVADVETPSLEEALSPQLFDKGDASSGFPGEAATDACVLDDESSMDDLMGSLAKDMQFIADGNVREHEKAESARCEQESSLRAAAEVSAQMLETPLISVPYDPEPLQKFAADWLVELGTATYSEPELRIPYECIFTEKFSHDRYRLFIAVNKSDGGASEDMPVQYRIICLSRTPKYNLYSAAVIDGDGYLEFSIPLSELAEVSSGAEFEKVVMKFAKLDEDFKVRMVLEDQCQQFGVAIAEWEAKHRIGHRAVKLAVIFSKEEQLTAPQMFANTQADHTPAFEIFLNTMGSRIKLENWGGYRGDVKDVEGTSYWNRWLPQQEGINQSVDVMYHVSTLMNSEMHRRLIGNDVAVILFRQSTVPIDPQQLDLGRVPQIFAVVQPVALNENSNLPGDIRFRIVCYQRSTVRRFSPAVPLYHTFDANELREFLLTKMVNGYNAALMSPPFSRLTTVPRTASLPDLCIGFMPKERSKFQEFSKAGTQKLAKVAKKAQAVASDRAASSQKSQQSSRSAFRRASARFSMSPWASRSKADDPDAEFQESKLKQ